MNHGSTEALDAPVLQLGLTASTTKSASHPCYKPLPSQPQLDEFIDYVRRREALLSSLFAQIDSRGTPDGHITCDELRSYMEAELRRPVTDAEARRLLQLLDTDASGTVEFEELLRGTLWTAGDASDVFRIWGQDPDHFYLATAAASDKARSTPTPPFVTALSGIISGEGARGKDGRVGGRCRVGFAPGAGARPNAAFCHSSVSGVVWAGGRMGGARGAVEWVSSQLCWASCQVGGWRGRDGGNRARCWLGGPSEVPFCSDGQD